MVKTFKAVIGISSAGTEDEWRNCLEEKDLR